MQNKNKNGMINPNILIVIGIGLIIYFGFFYTGSLFSEQNGTGYEDFSVTSNQVTYSNLNNFENTGFRANHFLTDEDSKANNVNFMYGADNKQFFTFYLEMNGINSNLFNAGGYKKICAFTPNEIILNNPIYQRELESLGFTYMAQEEGYTTSKGGDAGICNYDGCCATCWTGSGCSGNVNRACINGGFQKYVKTGENACWTGNYKNSILNSMAEKMICNVVGNGYDLSGKVGVTSTGFYCTIDPSKYPYDYMVKPTNPKVIFKQGLYVAPEEIETPSVNQPDSNNPETPSVNQNLSFFDKINIWIDSFFSWLFGGLK